MSRLIVIGSIFMTWCVSAFTVKYMTRVMLGRVSGKEKGGVYTNKPAPKRDPMLYATPSGDAEDTTAVTKSPASKFSSENDRTI